MNYKGLRLNPLVILAKFFPEALDFSWICIRSIYLDELSRIPFHLTRESSKNTICPSISDDIVIAGQSEENKTIEMKHLEVEPSLL